MRGASRVIAAAVIFGSLLIPSAKSQTLLVCEVLDRLTELNGKTINIRGAFLSSDMGGEYLWASPPCDRRIIRNGWSWMNAISARLDQDPQKFTYFQDQFKLFHSLKKAHPSEKILATLTGTLHTMDHFKVDGYVRRPLGFTYCVAEIVCSKVGDWKAAPYEPGEEEYLQKKAEHPDAVKVKKPKKP